MGWGSRDNRWRYFRACLDVSMDPAQQTDSKREQWKGEGNGGTTQEWEAARTQRGSRQQYAKVDHEKTRFDLLTRASGFESLRAHHQTSRLERLP